MRSLTSRFCAWASLVIDWWRAKPAGYRCGGIIVHSLLPCLLTGVTAGFAFAQRVPALASGSKGPASELHEAAIAQQGIDSVPFLDSAQLARTANVLRRVRAQFPELATAHAEGQFWSIELWLDSMLLAPTVRSRGKLRPRGHWATWDLKDTGIPALDRLNERFGVRALRLQKRGVGYDFDHRAPYVLRLDFAYAMDIAAVGAAYERVEGVQASAPSLDEALLTGNVYRVRRTGARWELRIDVGTGDCRSGCSTWIRHVVQFDEATGKAVLESRSPIPENSRGS